MAGTAPSAVTLALLLCCFAATCQCQGLARSPYHTSSVAASNAGMARLRQVDLNSAAWRRAYRTAATVACSSRSGSLCSASATPEERAQLTMATSPQKYDSRNGMVGFSAVGPVKDQGACNTCTAYVVLAAAQSAMACALGENASSQLSEHDFFFCKTVAPGEERSCTSSWTVYEAVQALVRTTNSRIYPVTERCMPNTYTTTRSCAAGCQDTLPALSKGTFRYVKLGTGWEVQEWIRKHGSVITRLDVYSDMKPFFAKNRSGVYNGPSKQACMQPTVDACHQNVNATHLVAGSCPADTIIFCFSSYGSAELQLVDCVHRQTSYADLRPLHCCNVYVVYFRR
jgi:hypothetical protein